MKRIFLLLTMALIVVAGLSAQERGPKKSREEMWKEFIEFKMKFIAQEIGLEEDQKTKFQDTYSEMTEEKGRIFEQTRNLERRIKKNDNSSEAEYAELCKKLTEAKEKDAEIEKKYDEKFATFLTGKQIYKMKDAEEKFRQKMREMRPKHPQGRKPGGDRK